MHPMQRPPPPPLPYGFIPLDGTQSIWHNGAMMLNSKKELCAHYHISAHVMELWIEEGLPRIPAGKSHAGHALHLYDTAEIDAWLKDNGYARRYGRNGKRKEAGKYISTAQAKRMFPNNPSMALLYAIFCTQEEYLNNFRKCVDAPIELCKDELADWEDFLRPDA